MMTKTEKIIVSIEIIAMLLLAVFIISTFLGKPPEFHDKTLEQIINANGSPVLISQHKFGDDVKPKVAMTYCQLLPFKRHVGDEQIYCWTEIIEE